MSSGSTPSASFRAIAISMEPVVNVMRNEHLEADALGNIYRAAYYMAKGDRELATSLVEKTRGVLKSLNDKAQKVIDCKDENSDRFIAEQLLDLYLNFK